MFQQSAMRRFSGTPLAGGKKRPTQWTLPNLDRLPGGFRGKVYNKRDWTEHLQKTTEISTQPRSLNIKRPPAGWRKRDLPEYMKNKYAVREKKLEMGVEGQLGLKRLSRTTIQNIQSLHDRFPDELTTDKLAEFFKISPVAISKILKSRWSPSDKESRELDRRWEAHTKKRATHRIMETQFEQFIAEKESQLHMVIPPFFKMELYSVYKTSGMAELEGDFEALNAARIARQRLRDQSLKQNLS